MNTIILLYCFCSLIATDTLITDISPDGSCYFAVDGRAFLSVPFDNTTNSRELYQAPDGFRARKIRCSNSGLVAVALCQKPAWDGGQCFLATVEITNSKVIGERGLDFTDVVDVATNGSSVLVVRNNNEEIVCQLFSNDLTQEVATICHSIVGYSGDFNAYWNGKSKNWIVTVVSKAVYGGKVVNEAKLLSINFMAFSETGELAGKSGWNISFDGSPRKTWISEDGAFAGITSDAETLICDTRSGRIETRISLNLPNVNVTAANYYADKKIMLLATSDESKYNLIMISSKERKSQPVKQRIDEIIQFTTDENIVVQELSGGFSGLTTKAIWTEKPQ